MKPSEIEVGVTYVNRGAGRTWRAVIAIGPEWIPGEWYSSGPRPNEPGVLFNQGGTIKRLYLSSFAAWAGKRA